MHAHATQRGFSLIELMVAMVITLIVTGSIFGLMTAGQGTFKREPELSDRQQNIRVAMALIQKDIAKAGNAMADRARAFTDLDGAGPATAPGLIKQADGSVPANTDALEIWGNDGECPAPLLVSIGGAQFDTNVPPSSCFQLPGLAVITNGAGQSEVICAWTHGGPEHIVHPHGLAPVINPTGPLDLPLTPPVSMSMVELVKYEIRLDATDLDVNGKPTPNLWRSPIGGGIYACGADPANSGWQLIGRGIEDMQVQYRTINSSAPGGTCPGGAAPAAGWCDHPSSNVPPVADTVFPNVPTYGDIVREVRVTLSSRTLGMRNLEGQAAGGTGGKAVRAQLTSTTTPRAALDALTRAPDGTGSAPLWR